MRLYLVLHSFAAHLVQAQGGHWFSSDVSSDDVLLPDA